MKPSADELVPKFKSVFMIYYDTDWVSTNVFDND